MIMPQGTRELDLGLRPSARRGRPCAALARWIRFPGIHPCDRGIDLAAGLGTRSDLWMEAHQTGTALERELAARQKPGADLGFPDGAAIGWVGFDGSFRFGFYTKLALFLHGTSSWHNTRELPSIAALPNLSRVPFHARLRKRQFEEMVMAAQDYIAAGDIYQVCLSHAFDAAGPSDPWSFYEGLRHYSPAPYAAFLDLGGTQIASASPECFLRLSGRRIETRPIKGTRPRRADTQLDQRNAYDLITSAKGDRRARHDHRSGAQ